MSSSQNGRKEDIPIPDIVIDPSTGNRYMKGKFLGKGGFARCYELTEMNSKEIFAGKIVSKQLLTKPHQKEKMTQEIAIHRAVHHQHIVEFFLFLKTIKTFTLFWNCVVVDHLWKCTREEKRSLSPKLAIL